LSQNKAGRHPREGGCHAAAPPNRNLKNTDFVDTMTLNILCDLSFSQNQPLKSADDDYITILINKIKKLSIS
jgi:hypothetical protein